MIKKDGSLIAKGMTDYFTQMQMAQIAEEIQYVQIAVEEVCKGQENDRLAMAHSYKQKLLQAMAIKKKTKDNSADEPCIFSGR